MREFEKLKCISISTFQTLSITIKIKIKHKSKKCFINFKTVVYQYLKSETYAQNVLVSFNTQANSHTYFILNGNLIEGMVLYYVSFYISLRY